MKILFATADDIAFKTLKAIFLSKSADFELAGVLAGKRDSRVKKSLVREFCRKNRIAYLTPENLREKEREDIKNTGCDFLLSFSISRIFGEKFLGIFKRGKINIHPSALPKYRGPSPLQFSILNGDRRGSISFQDIALGMDEGDIYKRIDFEVDESETLEGLREKVSLLAGENIVSFLGDFSKGLLKAKKQEGEASYTRLIKKEDGRADFERDDVLALFRKFRAFSPWPGLFSFLDGKRIIFTRVETISDERAQGALREQSRALESGSIVCFDKSMGIVIKLKGGFLLVKKLKTENGREVEALDFYNGFKAAVLEHKRLG